MAGAFPVVFAFGYLPADLYAHNIQALGNDVWLPRLFAAVGGALLIPVALLTLWRRTGSVTANVLFALGLFLLLADWVAPVQLATLDGARFGSDQPVLYTIIEAGAAAVVAILAWRMPRNSLRMRAQAVVSAVLALYVVASLAALPGSVSTVAPASPTTSSLPNIYQFHLDELQSDYALAAMSKPEFAADFTGFTFFRQNISNYPYTQPSVPSYLTSSIYRSGGYLDWVRAFDQGEWADLKAAGYRLQVVGLPEHVQTSRADPFVSPETLFKEDFRVQHPQLIEFTSLWLARLLPNAVTNAALDWGAGLGAMLSASLDTSFPADAPKTVEEGIHPFQAVSAFEHLRRHEAEEPASGRYLFFQAILPHAPYVYDASCAHKPLVGAPLPQQYEAQASCSVRLLAGLLAELKRLGRYDSSIIVIQSDHGSGWAGFRGDDPARVDRTTPFAPGFIEFGGTDYAFRSRAMATLVIKPAGATAPLKESEAPSELLDVYPTIADAAGFTPSRPVEGLSLLPCIVRGDCAALSARDRYFYAFPSNELGTNAIRRRVTFVDGRPVFASIEPLVTGN